MSVQEQKWVSWPLCRWEGGPARGVRPGGLTGRFSCAGGILAGGVRAEHGEEDKCV